MNDNTPLARIDPRKLFVDVDSLLGRAAAVGMQTGDLPDTFADSLMAWLRARSLGFAQQHRTGIALGRDLLHRGVVRAWTCVDEGLSIVTSANLEAAIARLVEGDLASLYRDGYESIHLQLERLRATASSWLADGTTLALFPDAEPALRRWSRTGAETWMAPGPEGDDEALDPLVELRRFADWHQTLGLAASLPRQAVRELVADEPGFDGGLPMLLRRLWLALVLGRQGLTADTGVIAEFRTRFSDGALGAQTAAAAVAQFESHLERAFDEPSTRQSLHELAARELACLSRASGSAEEFHLCLRQGLVADDVETAARDARTDVSRGT
ncbi:MAG TPA: hypothetical protein QGF95_03470 [Candidatus Latescibacteria bacterium]|jgi:hypothetical protein|nr:hypothetical protein [Gemmatimonadaceae bacterium]MDP6018482.1 hypothetical protein [Candidatus Latescibacterota bacterium]HJP29595.1 hypothetical protein [Candidatus Latescibacterota bacterium]|tara:strand:+ start:238 stop:1218 length:981 start_codon:yes stop_codon:yes gene_type:complete